MVLSLTRGQLLFDTAQSRQLLAQLGDAARQNFPITQPRPLRLPLGLQARLGLLVQHHHDFVLELLQRLLQLREAGQLRVGARQAALEILDAPRLLLLLDGHALQALIQLGELVAIAAVLLVQPAHHLAQLCQVHKPLSWDCAPDMRAFHSFSSTISPVIRKATRSPMFVVRSANRSRLCATHIR